VHLQQELLVQRLGLEDSVPPLLPLPETPHLEVLEHQQRVLRHPVLQDLEALPPQQVGPRDLEGLAPRRLSRPEDLVDSGHQPRQPLQRLRPAGSEQQRHPHPRPAQASAVSVA
jgi:hypothetical protein